MNAYSKASFDAAKKAAEKYRDAAAKEVTDNAKEKEKDHYEGKPLELEPIIDDIIGEIVPGDGGTVVKPLPIDIDPDDLQDGIAATEAWDARLKTAGAAAKAANTAAQQQKYARDAAMNKAISDAKKANENTRKETDEETGKEYAKSENSGWDDYYTTAMDADAKYMKAYGQAETAFNSSKKEADDAYTGTVTTGWLSYSKKMREYEAQFEIAVAHASDPNFNAGNWFNGGSGGQGDYLHVAYKKEGDGNAGNNNSSALSTFINIVDGYYIRNALGNGATYVAKKNVEFHEWAAGKTGNSYVVGAASFAANLEKNVVGLGVGLIKAEDTIAAVVDDFGQTIEVGKEHGVAVATGRQIGLLSFAEAYYGYDIMTMGKVDPWSKVAEGSGRFGATAGTAAFAISPFYGAPAATGIIDQGVVNGNSSVIVGVFPKVNPGYTTMAIASPNYPAWAVNSAYAYGGMRSVIGLPRVGSALKVDFEKPVRIAINDQIITREFAPKALAHGFPNIIDNYVPQATYYDLGNGATLFQISGSYNGVPGRFEWIIQNGTVTHRMFVQYGTTTGIPIKP